MSKNTAEDLLKKDKFNYLIHQLSKHLKDLEQALREQIQEIEEQEEQEEQFVCETCGKPADYKKGGLFFCMEHLN